MRDLIIKEAGKKVLDLIESHFSVDDNDTLVVSTTTAFNIEKQRAKEFHNIVNLKRMNDMRRINKFLEAVNSKLEMSGLFIIGLETYSLRKRRIFKKYPPIINAIYYFFDFLFKRVSPKLWGVKKIYFALTGGRNRVLSNAESLGRLYSCGFVLVEDKFINGMLYYVVKKVGEPAFDYNPTYGPIISLNRYGKNAKLIKVYKMRTMHAYSEYLQSYIYENNDLDEGGKFKNDFRITTLGKLLRKFWLDEFPMLFNLLKGDMKLFGIRPLSKQYYNLYDEELRERRIKYKPGLVPPFYVDMPKTLEEIMESEKNYLDQYDKNPFRTDWKYFWKAFRNIVFKKARSK